MASQFLGLNISYTGLLAANASLNTTANNISNTDTVGYSRQAVNQTAAEAIRTYTTFGCTGAGVDVKSVERIRDEFYDVKYWNNSQKLGEYDKKQYYMAQLEDYFADDDKVKGFTTIYNEMYNALEELQKSAGDSTVKTQFIGFADNLTTYFNEMASNLTKVQEDINSEIMVKVDEINSISQEIASLNKQINVIELTGSKANELRDQRTVLIDKLSLIVDVDVKEMPIYDTNNPERETGATRCIVTIAGGQTLVDISSYNELQCVARSNAESAYQSDANGLYDIYWNNGAEFGMYNASMGGELAGLIQMRDGNNGEYFNGTVNSISKDLNGKEFVTVGVTSDYLTDMTKLTLADSGVINVANTLFHYSSWSYDSAKQEYTFELDPSMNDVSISSSKLNKEASINQAIDYQGIPYYMEQLNEWTRLFAKSFNNILTQSGSVDGYGNEASLLFTGDTPMATQLGFRKEDNITGIITSKDDCYRRLTAANFTVSADIVKDAELLATHTDAQAGQDKYDVLEDLIGMKTNTAVMSFRGGNSGEFLECVLADVALNADRANTFYKNAEAMKASVQNQRTSISGVDQDEEAVNLVKYQNAYTLSSKMIQVLTEVYDRLILETGV